MKWQLEFILTQVGYTSFTIEIIPRNKRIAIPKHPWVKGEGEIMLFSPFEPACWYDLYDTCSVGATYNY